MYENATLKGNSLYPELSDNWNTLAPIIFMYERNTSRSNYVSRELRKFYFNDQPLSSASYRKLGDVRIKLSSRSNCNLFTIEIIKKYQIFFRYMVML